MGFHRFVTLPFIALAALCAVACGGGGGGGSLPPVDQVPASVKALDGTWRWSSGTFQGQEAIIINNGRIELTSDVKASFNSYGAVITWHENEVTDNGDGSFSISAIFTARVGNVYATEWDTATLTFTDSNHGNLVGQQRLYEFSDDATGTPDEEQTTSGGIYRN